MAILSRLIDFSAPLVAPQPLPVEDLPGYAEGHAAGRAQAEREAARHVTELTEALTALLRTEEAARRDVSQSMRPLFDVIGRHILPKTAPQALAAELAAHFSDIGTRLGDAPVVLRTAPGDAETLRQLLPADLAERVDLRPDPDLPALCVVLGAEGEEMIFDRGALIARVAALFDAFFDHITESETDD